MGSAYKRPLEVCIISDVHLGTYGCQANALLQYLKSIQPKTLILNGDIVDIWQFSKNYWPKSHMQVVRYILGLISKGTKVYYITGNHDELLRRFSGFSLGNFHILNKLVLPLANRKKAWIFHGDVFDVTMKHSKWLARLGGKGYDLLILLNTAVNFCSHKLGYGRFSFSQKIKHSVKKAVQFVHDFETTTAELAAEGRYDYVVCGHIHHAEIKNINTAKGQVTYLNSGDWVESLTALEYNKGEWELYRHTLMEAQTKDDSAETAAYLSPKEIYQQLIAEFKLPA
jgi:UDP-2,3-diacylglucosamine pyrophosphatase LpxH